MADRTVGSLTPATTITANDLFVLEQTGNARSLSGQKLTDWLLEYVQGRGGIQSITKKSTSGLVDTYEITYASSTEKTQFTVNNGNGISSITWTTSGTAGNGQTHTGTIHYTDGTTSTITFKDGVKGNTGAASYVYIRYAAKNPTSDSDMGTTPDKWIGIYSGTTQAAPTVYTAYTWYEIKGEKGDTGDPSILSSSTVSYQVADSGTSVPQGNWSNTFPSSYPAGKYLWTRTVLHFNTGSPVTYYSVSHNGIDGSGAVASVNSVSPADELGNVEITAADIASVPDTPALSDPSLAKDIQTIRTNVSAKQGIINISGASSSAHKMLMSTGSGSVSAAVKGTDYGALSFTLTIPTGGWTAANDGYEKTITIASGDSNYGKFLATGYAYQVSPAFSSLDDYISSQIFVKDITANNQVPLFCKEPPTNVVTLNVIRMVSA